jgi:peptidyl-prolyl cis-trans isomerase SurA
MSGITKLKILTLFICLISAFLFYNCNHPSSKTLAEIGDEKITLGEFEKQYLKTIGNPDTARNKPLEDKKDFLNLYINFRLKVKDARERGMLNDPEIKKEIDEYKKNFTPTYLVDKEIVTAEIKKLYENKKQEYRASHILLNLSTNPSPEDSVRAYQTADTIIQKLKDGFDFGELALQYSDDRTVKTNRGDLYYFTAGMTVPEFEKAVFELKVGSYTKQPVRTQFGLHIVKLTDKKPRIESVRISHILIQDKRDSLGNIIDSAETHKKIIDIYNRAKNGESFESLVEQFSEDQATKLTKGDLGYISRRRLAQPLDSAAFAMKTGDISAPIRTPYGWHIVMKTDEKPLEPFEKVREQLKDEYKRTNKYKEDYNKYVETLKEKYNFKITDAGLDFLKSVFDSLKTLVDYNLDNLFTPEQRGNVIAEFKDGKVTINDMINHLNINRDFSRMNLNEQTLKAIINSASENLLLNKKAAEIKIEKEDEYIANLTDYENGLLVFKIDQDEIWSKVTVTEDEISSYYSSNKSKYIKSVLGEENQYRSLDEVRAEISNELQQAKYKERETAYLQSLKQKYPVIIHEEILLDAFKD